MFFRFKKVINFFQTRADFVRYFLVGVSGTVLDLASLALFKSVFLFNVVTAIMINQIIVLLYIFLLNKYWTFGARSDASKQAIRFGAVLLLNYLIAICWIWFWAELFGFNYLIVRVVNIALSISWNFVLYKYWVYRTDNKM